MIYYFLGWDGQDIEGAAYDELIDVCFKYSEYFSLIYQYGLPSYGFWEKYRIFSQITREWPGMGGPEVLYEVYRCTEETREILKNFSDSLFSWVNFPYNPDPRYHKAEDLTFYRGDQSVFMCATTHESECVIMNREGEDVSQIVSQPLWKIVDCDPNTYISPPPNFLG